MQNNSCIGRVCMQRRLPWSELSPRLSSAGCALCCAGCGGATVEARPGRLNDRRAAAGAHQDSWTSCDGGRLEPASAGTQQRGAGPPAAAHCRADRHVCRGESSRRMLCVDTIFYMQAMSQEHQCQSQMTVNAGCLGLCAEPGTVVPPAPASPGACCCPGCYYRVSRDGSQACCPSPGNEGTHGAHQQ